MSSTETGEIKTAILSSGMHKSITSSNAITQKEDESSSDSRSSSESNGSRMSKSLSSSSIIIPLSASGYLGQHSSPALLREGSNVSTASDTGSCSSIEVIREADFHLGEVEEEYAASDLFPPSGAAVPCLGEISPSLSITMENLGDSSILRSEHVTGI